MLQQADSNLWSRWGHYSYTSTFWKKMMIQGRSREYLFIGLLPLFLCFPAWLWILHSNLKIQAWPCLPIEDFNELCVHLIHRLGSSTLQKEVLIWEVVARHTPRIQKFLFCIIPCHIFRKTKSSFVASGVMLSHKGRCYTSQQPELNSRNLLKTIGTFWQCIVTTAQQKDHDGTYTHRQRADRALISM